MNLIDKATSDLNNLKDSVLRVYIGHVPLLDIGRRVRSARKINETYETLFLDDVAIAEIHDVKMIVSDNGCKFTYEINHKAIKKWFGI